MLSCESFRFVKRSSKSVALNSSVVSILGGAGFMFLELFSRSSTLFPNKQQHSRVHHHNHTFFFGNLSMFINEYNICTNKYSFVDLLILFPGRNDAATDILKFNIFLFAERNPHKKNTYTHNTHR